MAFSSRELILIVRARDEATRVLSRIENNAAAMSRRANLNKYTAEKRRLEDFASMYNVSRATELRNAKRAYEDAEAARVAETLKAQRKIHGAMAQMAAGTGLLTFAGLSIRAFDTAADAAQEYAQDASVSFTQVEDRATDSLDNIKALGLDTARNFAVNFEQIQPAIYDIFSSVEEKGEGAKKVLEGIAKAAIGGATDMQTAGASIIGIMNAWDLGAKDVNRINDHMFQLVRKGRGTFQQFTGAMGKAIPSAKNAGQSIEEVSAMLMLMTRSGMTTAMSGTSAARAMDLLANPIFEKNLKAQGMSVFDNSGKMKQMSEVVKMLGKHMKGMSLKEQTKEWKELAGGAGNNTQARKFFNLALTDTAGTYKLMQKYAKNAGGAADDAYNIMKDTPQAKMQLFTNQWETFKVGVGEVFNQVKVFIASALTPLLNWFNQLSPAAKNSIAAIVGIVTAIAGIAGVVLLVMGGMALLSGIGLTLGGIFAAVAWPILAVVAAVALVGGAAYLLIQNWDSVKAWWDRVWQDMQRVIEPFIEHFNRGLKKLSDGWEWFMAAVGPALDNMGKSLSNFMNAAGPIFNWIVAAILAVLVPAWEILSSIVGKVMGGIGSMLGGLINVLSGVIDFIVALFTGNWQGLWDATVKIFQGIVQMITGFFQTLGGALAGIVSGVIGGIIDFFFYLWDVLVGHSIIPDTINAIVEWFKKLPGWVFGVVSGFVSGVVKFIAALPGKAVAAVAPFVSGIKNKATEAWNGFKSAVSTGISNAITTVKELPGKIKGALSGAIGWLKNVGENVVQGLINGIKSMWDNAVGWISRLGNAVVNAAKKAFNQNSPSKKFFDIGANNIKGMINGTLSQKQALMAAYNGLTSVIPDGNGGYTFGVYSDNGSNSYLTGSSAGQTTNKIGITVNTQEIDPIKHSADLGFELAARLNF